VQLFVGSIKEEMTEEHLREYFSQFGSIASIDITKDRNTGQRRGFAFVTFNDYDPVDKIICKLLELHWTVFYISELMRLVMSASHKVLVY